MRINGTLWVVRSNIPKLGNTYFIRTTCYLIILIHLNVVPLLSLTIICAILFQIRHIQVLRIWKFGSIILNRVSNPILEFRKTNIWLHTTQNCRKIVLHQSPLRESTLKISICNTSFYLGLNTNHFCWWEIYNIIWSIMQTTIFHIKCKFLKKSLEK